jgi:pimeloyl-ACP methyl ester carboxylesterase
MKEFLNFGRYNLPGNKTSGSRFPCKNHVKRFIWIVIIIFVLINMVAIFHSYKFTHYTSTANAKIQPPEKLTISQKISAIVFGVSIPRPTNEECPSTDYKTIYLNSNYKIECWEIKTGSHLGTVILFHGYGSKKSSMLGKANILIQHNYNVLLVDFMGSGGSEGNRTTIGYLEAEQVKTCFDYIVQKGETKIYLLGISMGAAAIMKAINDYEFTPAGIIIECPFGTMYETVCARFRNMNLPSFPIAGLLVFWGGVQNKFWAFGHNPVNYAKRITCPALLMYGAQDKNVSRKEMDKIFANLQGKKQFCIYPNAGHDDYLEQYETEWTQHVITFVSTP